MRRILVTGANKGIGFAIAEGILTQHDDTYLLLGSRDRARGEAALAELTADRPALAQRVSLVEMDVASEASVAAAARAVCRLLGEDGALYAVVNNAGIGLGSAAMRDVLEVNTVGVRRVCETFLPLLDPAAGRVVIVSSAAGPNFVAECSEERKRVFLDGSSDWKDLEALMQECLAIAGDAEAFAERGLGKGNPYGLSKACVNTYMLQLARRHPGLAINACTPGFIETDLTRDYALTQGKTPAQVGMKSPQDGARAPLRLLFDELEGNGRYYGSDGKRSPLDRYRAPGAPEYGGTPEHSTAPARDV